METTLHLREDTGAAPAISSKVIDPTTPILRISETPNQAQRGDELTIFVDVAALLQLREEVDHLLDELRGPALPTEVWDVLKATQPAAGEALPRYTQFTLTVQAVAEAYGIDSLELSRALKAYQSAGSGGPQEIVDADHPAIVG